MNAKDLVFGAHRLVHEVAAVQPGESVLTVTDHATDRSIANSIDRAVREAGASSYVLTMAELRTDSGEPPLLVARSMLDADVVFAAVQVSLTHSDAVRDFCARGGRVAALTQWIPDMLVAGGIEADFRAIEPRVLQLAAVWDSGREVHVTTIAGTDITLDIRGRLGTPHAKTGVVRPGTFHPIPDIESPVSPVSGEGRIVCDGSIPYLGIGLVHEPVTIDVVAGRVASIRGGDAAERVCKSWRAMHDPNVYNLAELGVGMNPHCRLRGLMLEDEGVATTCHFGFGTSTTLGGTVKAACHYDFVVRDPTITVDGDVVMEGGRLWP